MSKLDTLRARLEQQYLSPQQAALPPTAVEEAIRLTLERIRSSFKEDFEIEGLDGATKNTLPEAFLPALMTGVGAALMRFILQNHLSSYSNLSGEPVLMQNLSAYLEARFDWLLEGLRLDYLQSAVDLPFSRWEWEENQRWQV